MSVSKIPLNTGGKMISINGYAISEAQWSRIVHCANMAYENTFDEDDPEHDLEYRCSEIIEQLRLMSEDVPVGEFESSAYDPQVDALFETFSEEIIESFILFGEEKDWDFDIK